MLGEAVTNASRQTVRIPLAIGGAALLVPK